MEKSLVFIKPDAVRRNLIGAIIALYEEKGLVVERLEKMTPTLDQVEEHYAEHKGKGFYPGLIDSILAGDVVAMVLTGEHAIETIRSLNGATDPRKAEAGTIRALYGGELPHNAVHASDSAESAERETAIWFKSR